MNNKRQNYVFGIHPVEILLQKNSHQVARILVQQQASPRSRLTRVLDLAGVSHIEIEYCERSVIEKLTERAHHQGVVALLKENSQKENIDLKTFIENATATPLILILDNITDPHNLGACLRTAEAAGVLAVIAPKDRSVGITPVVRKVACGAAETLPFIVVTNLARTLKQLQEWGVWIIGTGLTAECRSIYDSDLSRPIAWVLGAEGTGLRQLTLKNCDEIVRIPMRGSVQSLNVSVATGICLFETLRQRTT